MTSPTPAYRIFATRAAWRVWLAKNHDKAASIWLAHYKKGVGKRSVSYGEAVEEALCFGWIDGLTKGIDAEKFAQRYSPRKPGSVWSVSNIARVERLIAERRMTPAGMAHVELAKLNGEWDAALAREDVDTVPADLERALRRRGLWADYSAWAPSHKKQYLYWLSSAKRPETRQKRLEAIVEAAFSMAAAKNKRGE